MHFIGKTSLTLRISGAPAEAYDLQQQALRMWEQEVLPALDDAFSQLAGKNDLIQIEKLEVDVSGLSPSNWQQELPRHISRAVLEAIEKQLNKTVPNATAKRIPITLGHFESWRYFLEHGVLPFTGVPGNEDAMRQAALEIVAAESSAQQSLLLLLRRHDRALQRLLWQHPDKFLQALAEAITGRSQQNALAFKREMEALLAQPLETKTASATATKRDTALEPKAIPLSKSLKTSLTAFQEKWPEIFWITLWQEYILVDKPFDAVFFLKSVLNKGLKTSVSGSVLRWFKHTATTDSGKFPLALPALISLEKQLSIDKKGPLPDNQKNEFGTENEPATKRDPSIEAGIPPSDSKQTTEIRKETRPENIPKTSTSTEKSSLDQGSTTDKTTEPASQTAATRSEKTHWYVPNAGVVLMHPFLPVFFQKFDLTTGGEFKNEATRHKAIYLLHYLATGEFDAPEYDLVFPKHLCGIDPETPIQKPKSNKKGYKQMVKREAEALLQAAITHWKRLGSTSPDGLRNGFLRRAGKLSVDPSDGWILQMEQNGIDVLLDSLPWGLGIVKTPWMKEMMAVEWTVG